MWGGVEGLAGVEGEDVVGPSRWSCRCAMNSGGPVLEPGRALKLIELVRRKFSLTFRPRVLKKKVTELVKRCPVCQTCKTGPARFDECRFFPVLQYPFASLAIDFVSLPEVTSAGQVYDQCMVIVDRLTGYLTAVPCRAQGLDVKAAADLFLQRCLFFTGVPKEIMSDNDNVITSDFPSQFV